jgi:heme A synthase
MSELRTATPARPTSHPKQPRSPHRSIRGLWIAVTAVTFGLVTIGGLVRATGSGEGCSGWPKCSPGHWLPPLQYHPIVEYSHRMTAFADIVLVGIVAIVATRRYRREPTILRTAWVAVGLIVAQAVLGGIVVKGDLSALLVTAHFGTAMILVAVLVYGTVAAFTLDVERRLSVDGFTVLARVAAGATFALMAVGTYVRGIGAGLVFRDWPLMNGRLVPRFASEQAVVHFTHRVLAGAVACAVVALAVWAWRERHRRPAAAELALISVVLFAVQIMVGAANVWSHLAPAAVVSHVALAGLVWGALSGTAFAARLPGPSSRPAADPGPVEAPADPRSLSSVRASRNDGGVAS